MENKKFNVIFGAWIVSLIATFGSLFFSEIMRFPPCSLCWYQRIFMYPLTFFLLFAIVRKSLEVIYASFLFLIPAIAISFFHNLLMYGVIPKSASPCSMGVPCSTSYIKWLGFVTIPFLALCAFIIIFLLLIIFIKSSKDQNNEKR